jgi:2-C-methyl-D-erythritol 4-phosphate cytidylyltransferase/2-C-methyl-D-erythritol 2,4-cyclodiphosphate synthase
MTSPPRHALPPADAIVVAAGASRRMGGQDKLMARVAGRPLLAWTLEAVAAARSVRRVIVVAASERVAEVAAQPWVTMLGARVVAGGPRRQESVAAGVAASDASLVLVHDGARPLVTPGLVDRVALAASEHGAAIPVLPVSETLKRVTGSTVGGTVERQGLAAAQTPQGARRELLLAAFAAHDPAGSETFTDEAALLEADDVAVVAVRGEASNLKVTEPDDLDRTEAILSRRLGPPRVGFASDVHPFGPGEGLALGGIMLADAPRLHGHSDGDVALHAVAGALLGAAGMGDLGRLFPATDAGIAGAASRELLRDVVGRLEEAGWRPSGVDLTITGARPLLGPERLDSMGAAVAGLLGLAPAEVGVKASTGNLQGPEGAGRSISAAAVASLVRRWPSG